MPRTKRGVTARARHKKILGLAKGHKGQRHRVFRRANESVLHALDYAYGHRRERKGDGFEYFKPNGDRLADEAVLERIRKLAIPPAYTDVWICPRANGHLQATGRDARGRKQ